jgi:hypothetical protein
LAKNAKSVSDLSLVSAGKQALKVDIKKPWYARHVPN